MNANATDSPPPSDSESNNPYDVLRDDDDDEVPTDLDQKSGDESEDKSLRSEPSESEYESATDTISLTSKLKKPKRTSDDSIVTQEPTQSLDSQSNDSIMTRTLGCGSSSIR
jgi:hypothetical protein